MGTMTKPNSIEDVSFGREFVHTLKPFIAGLSISTVARESGLDESCIVALASNENPLGMPDGACRAIEILAKRGDAQYPDPEAHELKRSIGQIFQVPYSWIAVGNGSSELLEMAARAFVDQGQSVVVSQYAYSAYLLAVATVSARPIRMFVGNNSPWDRTSSPSIR